MCEFRRAAIVLLKGMASQNGIFTVISFKLNAIVKGQISCLFLQFDLYIYVTVKHSYFAALHSLHRNFKVTVPLLLTSTSVNTIFLF